MKKEVVRKIVGVLLIAFVVEISLLPELAESVQESGFVVTLIAYGLAFVVWSVLMAIGIFGIYLVIFPKGTMICEKENYYTRAVQEIMQGIKNEKILRCIYIFAKDIENEIKEDAKGHEQK